MIHRSIQVPSLLLCLGLASALVAACGGSTPPADAPEGEAPAVESGEETADEEAPAEEAPEEGGEEAKAFDEMSPPEKMKHMKTVIAPGMAKVFQEADAEEYANFGCTTCHGPGAKQGNFEMPSDALPKLDMAKVDFNSPVAKFMSERVVPEMAKMLGEEPYNPETHQGFGCFGCHQKAE